MEQTFPRPAPHLSHAHRWWKALATLARQLRQTFNHWNAVKAQRLGAALAYYTIFALAPLLIIAILIAGAIFGQTAAKERVVGEVSYLMGPQGAAGVSSLLDQQTFPGQSGVLPTVISLATLFLGAIGLFGQLQDAFDTVWEVTPPPTHGLVSIIRQRILPFGMVLAFGFLLLVALVINAALTAISTYLGPQIPYFALLNTAINVILPLVVTTLLFAALFKSVPHVQLKWRDLWPGAALTAVLFTIGKIAIGFYLGHSSLASATGATGSLLVVLVWVYYSSQILLFGAVFTRVYAQSRSGPALPTGAHPMVVAGGQLSPTGHWTAPSGTRASFASAPRANWLGAVLVFVAALGAGLAVALRRQHTPGSTHL